jgi:uncharacterized protein (UPF0335 family)
MVWDHLNPTSFTPLPARAEDLRALIERVEALEQRVRELEIRQEQNDESARERTEREG